MPWFPKVITDPTRQRVLDPSCGSGTFLFYAVRRFLDAANASSITLADAMARLSTHVVGIDLHPVAVALARVTYLLALGRERLTSRERGTLSVPVYLGDSLGWDQATRTCSRNPSPVAPLPSTAECPAVRSAAARRSGKARRNRRWTRLGEGDVTPAL